MRDPLHSISVKHKLALMFVVLCLIAFGLGGFLISRSARGVLEREIHSRLVYQCQAYATALDSYLQMLERRTEDFASDGHIRELLHRISGRPGGEEADALRAELGRHLRKNKLPLVASFRDLTVVDRAGQVVVAVHDLGSAQVTRLAVEASGSEGNWYSGVLPAVPAAYREAEGGPGPTGLAIGTPLYDLDGAERIGSLLAWVDAGAWLTEAVRSVSHTFSEGEDQAQLSLRDRLGRRLSVRRESTQSGDLRTAEYRSDPPAPGTAPSGVRQVPPIVEVFEIPANGWEIEVILQVDRALESVSGLQSDFLGVGVVLAVLSAFLMFFPIRFLAQPLVQMEQAAQRISSGEFGSRVAVNSGDEIGRLASSFNRMAEAIQERASRLERSAGDLRSERDRLNTVISSMRDGLLVLDGRGEVVLKNAAVEPLIQLRDTGGSGASRHVCKVEPAPADCLACVFQPHSDQQSCVIEAGGRVFEVHSASLTPDEHGRSGRVLVSRDVTDRINQDEREIHQERLSVLGEVAAVVAHELNNPLASISMFNQMMEAELEAGSPLRENVEVIQRNTETCKKTIRELLDYATGASPEIGPIDLHDTVESIVRFLRPISDRARVRLVTRLEAGNPWVTGDEVQLRQVFVNLVMNAVQAIVDGGEVVLESFDEDDHLVIEVRDTGPGIKPEDRGQIFRPFFTTKARGDGTGLGLSTAQRIAEMHGGGLTLAESSPAGTVFRVRLRARQEV
ncbi:MAG: HAMP domain-containing protein [Planctomycetes bacterium]|nr:HAMP domain-containing protein [Planctomycetota bacterium]MBL7007394.1 HAMP domain-containing protein [Planctomycetota bacterium]